MRHGPFWLVHRSTQWLRRQAAERLEMQGLDFSVLIPDFTVCQQWNLGLTWTIITPVECIGIRG